MLSAYLAYDFILVIVRHELLFWIDLGFFVSSVRYGNLRESAAYVIAQSGNPAKWRVLKKEQRCHGLP